MTQPTANCPLYLSRPAFVSADADAVPTIVKFSDGAVFCTRQVAEEALPLSAPTRILRLCVNALTPLKGAIQAATTRYGRERIAVGIGSCDNGSEWSRAAHERFLADGFFPPDYDFALQSAGFVADFVAREIGAGGDVFTAATACASSVSAIAKAAEFIRAGFCDAAIVGGADVITETALRGFAGLGAVAPGLTNPFSKNRVGITLGEAAVFFVLSPDDLSGDNIQLLGVGESADAFHLTAPAENGEGAAQAMLAALADADLVPADIDYLNLHGTGTETNDRAEARAVTAVFGEYAVPVSSTKPQTGHTLGAAGAIELALGWQAIVDGRLPPHEWDGEFDEKLPPLNFVRRGDGFRSTARRIVMSNSLAFGDCNVCLIIGRK